jgi:hypothetical protein
MSDTFPMTCILLASIGSVLVWLVAVLQTLPAP